MSSLFDIGLSGLRASKYAMHLTGNNISNANNPFFARRTIDFIENNSDMFGGGVKLGDVRRLVDTLVNNQVLNVTQDWSKSSSLYERLENLETYIDKDETSVVKFINESLSALETLNTTPGSLQGRNHYLNQLNNMANRIQDVGGHLLKEQEQTRKDINSDVSQINEIIGKLAVLNEKMGPHNQSDKISLLDQQDELLDKLAHLINFENQNNGEGVLKIQLANGMPLLLGTQATTLSVQHNDNGKIDIAIQGNNNTVTITDLIKGGELGGAMEYLSNKLDNSLNEVNRLALSLAYKMNQQNQLGVDTQGNLGKLIFQDTNAQNTMANRVTAARTNLGSGDLAVKIQQPSELSISNYILSFDSPTHYSLLRTSDGEQVNSGTISGYPVSIIAEGFSVDIQSGSFSPGDTYTISPLKNGASNFKLAIKDGGKLALGLPVLTSEIKTNKGDGKINLSAMLDTTNPAFSIPKQLNPPLRIEFITGTTYRLVNANDNSTIEDNINYDPVQGANVFPTAGAYDPGFRIQLSGNMVAGDAFSIDYNADGLGDNRNGLELAELYNSPNIDGNRMTFSQAYQAFMFNISSATSTMKITVDANEILKNQAQAKRDENSSVSLEEETMNLARYQESYLASAQVLEAVRQSMDAVFALLRR